MAEAAQQETPKEKQRQECEVYSRVVGFLTPVSQWNKGKKAEWEQRKTFDDVLMEAE